MRAISRELQPLLSVLAAVLDSRGLLLEANAGFMHLLGARTALRIGADVAGCFSKPGFQELNAAQAFANGEVYMGTMRFNDGGGGVIEMRGRVWRSAFGLCVLAEGGVAASAPADTAGAAETNARRQAQRQLQVVNVAQLDKLTGTGNRDRLTEVFATELTRVQRTGAPLGVLVAGPDRFGDVGAKHGKDSADKVLARCGFLLRLLTRPTDIVTRSSAEEFAVLLPHTNLAQAVSAAERMRKVFEKDVTEPPGVPVTVSFGVAELQSGEDLDAFLGRAGKALRQAWDGGHNQVVASS